MKLKCSEKRRVMILPSGKVIHRSNGSSCDDKPLTIGNAKIDAAAPLHDRSSLRPGYTFASDAGDV